VTAWPRIHILEGRSWHPGPVPQYVIPRGKIFGCDVVGSSPPRTTKWWFRDRNKITAQTEEVKRHRAGRPITGSLVKMARVTGPQSSYPSGLQSTAEIPSQGPGDWLWIAKPHMRGTLRFISGTSKRRSRVTSDFPELQVPSSRCLVMIVLSSDVSGDRRRGIGL